MTRTVADTFVRDAVSGATTRVSVTAAGAESRDGVQCGSTPAISDDGRYVVFVSDASDLVPGDANGQVDVFVRDRVASTTRRVSVSSAGIERMATVSIRRSRRTGGSSRSSRGRRT
jgi:Tol biopolymer transport system component